MGYFKKATKSLSKALPKLNAPAAITPPLPKINWNGGNNAAILGGLAGAGFGPIGMAAGALIGDKIGGGKAGIADKLRASLGGKTPPRATYGSEMPMPSLSEYKGIEGITPYGNLREKGMLDPRTISGAQISSEMEQSPWYRMALDKQRAEEMLRVGQGAQQAMTGAAQARSNLAARGGLRGGAAERLAQQSMQNLMTTRQNILGQGAVERSGLGMQAADLASKIGQFNVGQQSAADLQNLKTQLLDLDAREKRKLFEYGEGMKLKGAGMSAQALENAKSPGLFQQLFGGG